MKEAHDRLVSTIESQKIIEKMDVFDKEKEKSPLFKVVRQYMRMVMEMIIHSRRSNWRLDTSPRSSRGIYQVRLHT